MSIGDALISSAWVLGMPLYIFVGVQTWLLFRDIDDDEDGCA